MAADEQHQFAEESLRGPISLSGMPSPNSELDLAGSFDDEHAAAGVRRGGKISLPGWTAWCVLTAANNAALSES